MRSPRRFWFWRAVGYGVAAAASSANAAAAWLGLLAVLALAGCAPSEYPPPPEQAAGLPHAVLVDDGSGRQLRLNVGPVVDGGQLFSRFGARRSSMGGDGGPHQGIDIAGREGTPVRAAAAGMIAEVGRRGRYGRFIRIRHADRIETAYAHLSRFADRLEIGRSVQQGEVIGYVGTSGRSTGPHLHFEIRRDGKPVDPLGFPVAAMRPYATFKPFRATDDLKGLKIGVRASKIEGDLSCCAARWL